MAAGQGLDVAGIAQKILNAVTVHLNAASGITVPDRRIIAPGNIRLIAWDNCEQLIVALSGIGLGAAPGQGGTPQRTGNPVSAMGLRHAVFAVQLVRWAPESQDGTSPPEATKVTTAGLALMRDAGLLSQALVEACSSVKASTPLGRQGSVQPGAVEVIGPDGGMAAVEGSIAITAGDLT
jgi:hypothetical protein